MIRPLGLALLAAFTLMAAPFAAQAAPAAPAQKIDTKIDPDQHAAGKKDAPAALKSAGIPCTLTDAYYIGQSDSKDDKGKPVTVKIYEVACQGALGQVLFASSAGTTTHFDCIHITTSPNIRCRLPGDADVKTAAAPLLAAAGRTCAISDVRYVGGTPSGDNYYEIGCTGALGFVIKQDAANATKVFDCSDLSETNLKCALTSPEAIKAASRAVIDKLTATSGVACPIKDTRDVAKLVGGGSVYEIACTDGKTGYFLQAKADGSFDHAIPCAKAEGILGGCKLTDATVSQTAEAATYTKLSRAAGFDCDVAKYRFIGMDTKNNEVVELACSNRPDGGIAVLPADNSTGRVLDCVRAGVTGQACKLTDPALVFDHYTQALVAKGKTSCKVTNAHYLASSTESHTDFIETACSDGLPGWVMEMDSAGKTIQVLSCGQMKSSGAVCVLPGNVK